MRTLAWLPTVILILALTLPGCAPSTEELTKAPEDIIPLAVPDFTFVKKKERVELVIEGGEYYAYSYFTQKESSRSQNKVEDICIEVLLFKDEITATAFFEWWTQGATETQTKGVNTRLTYTEDFITACATQQRGKLVIRSFAFSSLEVAFLRGATPDKKALKDAAIQGLKAIRL